MMDIQQELNSKLFSDWSSRKLDWTMAMLQEGAELVAHAPWKWWKKNADPIKWGQVQMEAVDIWHFLLSEFIENGMEASEVAEMWEDEVFQVPSATTFDPSAAAAMISKATKRFLLVSLTEDESLTDMQVSSFKALAQTLGLSMDDLYKQYVGKAQLNKLRWENGYGSTYIKEWNGREDNEALQDILNTTSVDHPEFPTLVLESLRSAYKTVRDEALLSAAKSSVEAMSEGTGALA
jgi:dimeric dUTPase (all-alpha-NTP-PPase superfamily)